MKLGLGTTFPHPGHFLCSQVGDVSSTWAHHHITLGPYVKIRRFLWPFPTGRTQTGTRYPHLPGSKTLAPGCFQSARRATLRHSADIVPTYIINLRHVGTSFKLSSCQKNSDCVPKMRFRHAQPYSGNAGRACHVWPDFRALPSLSHERSRTDGGVLCKTGFGAMCIYAS